MKSEKIMATECGYCKGTGIHYGRDAQGGFIVMCPIGCELPKVHVTKPNEHRRCENPACHAIGPVNTQGLCAACEEERQVKYINNHLPHDMRACYSTGGD